MSPSHQFFGKQLAMPDSLPPHMLPRVHPPEPTDRHYYTGYDICPCPSPSTKGGGSVSPCPHTQPHTHTHTGHPCTSALAYLPPSRRPPLPWPVQTLRRLATEKLKMTDKKVQNRASKKGLVDKILHGHNLRELLNQQNKQQQDLQVRPGRHGRQERDGVQGGGGAGAGRGGR